LIEGDRDYAAAHRALTGALPEARTAEAVLVTVAKVLAAFQSTLISGRTAFDDARDRIMAGTEPEASGLAPAALRGLRLFVGPAGCIACHGGPHFTDDAFHAVLPLIPVQGRRLDRGRPDGLSRLAADAYGQDSAHSDARGRTPRMHESLTSSPAVAGAFRTPSLRGVTSTAPYLHDGRARALADAVAHGPAGRSLTPEAISDLIEFLTTLTASE
jgi:cytochrome c peroxidase